MALLYDEKQQALQRAKWLASGLLLFVTALYIVARSLESWHWAWSYVASFAEASMVGALADWFAVEALFRHPLNLPIPHTAIIPKSKESISKNLSNFIVGHFMDTKTLMEKVREFDPAGKLAAWLSRDENGQMLGDYTVRGFAVVLDAIDDDRVKRFIHDAVIDHLQEVDISKISGNLLDLLTQNNRHQALLDELLKEIEALLDKENIRQRIAKIIGDEMGFLRYLRLEEVAGRYSAEKIVAIIHKLLQEVNSDPQHSIRQEFDLSIADFISKLKSAPEYRLKIEQIKEEILSRPELNEYLHGIWSHLKEWLRNDLRSADSSLRAGIAATTLTFGRKLAADEGMRSWINEQILTSAPPFIEKYRDRIRLFIEKQISEWDERFMVEQIELNIGKDLQYIRLNGTLVGGLIGLIIHVSTTLIRG